MLTIKNNLLETPIINGRNNEDLRHHHSSRTIPMVILETATETTNTVRALRSNSNGTSNQVTTDPLHPKEPLPSSSATSTNHPNSNYQEKNQSAN